MIDFDRLVLWEKIMVADEATRQAILNRHPHLDGRITVNRYCPPNQILGFNPSLIRIRTPVTWKFFGDVA